ncbi:DNA-directed RNA polymerase II subunit RPB2 [Pelomyxa schiedti]|nr:DNA-directed RNA polymerase II subunit RPB2 [Pelomyxa schiedti]
MSMDTDINVSPEEEINFREDPWFVISAFFEKKGMVRQQLDSFDEFITMQLQELVQQAPPITLFPARGAAQDPTREKPRTQIQFGQVYLSKPVTEYDARSSALYPNEARLRNLTYASPLYVDIRKEKENGEGQDFAKVKVGNVPIMLRSSYCVLHGLTEQELAENGECPYDQGGYFIVNGSEKVIVAQEKMSCNHVYVFKKKPPSKYAFIAEIRSTVDVGYRPISTMYIKMLAKGSSSKNTGQCIRATLPLIRKDIPIIVVFRALGFVADRDILEHICYDFNDTEMMELLRPSLEEAVVIQDRNVALDFIGKRGSAIGALLEKRIRHAKDVLQKEVLPHVGVKEDCDSKKAYYFGYGVHRLLLVALGRRPEDDRDHYGNKRLDLSGTYLPP